MTDPFLELLLPVSSRFPTLISFQFSTKNQAPVLVILTAVSQCILHVILIFPNQILLGIKIVSELYLLYSSTQLQQINVTIKRRTLVYYEMKLFWTRMVSCCVVSPERRQLAHVHCQRKCICNEVH